MPKCLIDGREVEFKPGENLIEIARRAGVEIPYFCYHPALSVVAQCRMCAIEVEKMPKLQTACSTPATDGMVVRTKSDRVKQNQKSIMEFLLMNHPLDCPVCDKSGECDLQDYSYRFGDAYMRMTEERRTYMDLDMGPVIQKNMNRCIHCTRCIRFGDEIAGIREMVAVQRGNNTEITTIDGRPLETGYAGNYADICPTGALTLKDFRFRKRAWFLKKTPTVCEGCSRGCNMEMHHEAGAVYRCIPRTNMEVNRYWLCDEGRFNYHYTQDSARVVEPAISVSGTLAIGSWDSALGRVGGISGGEKTVVLVGSDLTQEELTAILQFSTKALTGSEILHFGTPGLLRGSDDVDEDKILKRKSKTSNLHGAERLGIKPLEKIPPGAETAVIFRGGRAKLPAFPASMKVVGVGVFMKPEANRFESVLPGAAFSEKDGTVVNSQGREQRFRRAVAPPGQSKPLSEILMLWMSRRSATGAA